MLDKIAITFKALGRGKESGVGAKDLSGPVGIFGMLAIQVNHDLRLALSFLVLLNINLAILNLLPVPVLDARFSVQRAAGKHGLAHHRIIAPHHHTTLFGITDHHRPGRTPLIAIR